MRRRTAICTALLFMLAYGAHASTLCVNAPGVVVLADDRGVEKTENGRFESAFVVRKGVLFAAGRKGAYSLFDAEGQPIVDAQFSMIDDNGESLVFSNGHLFGAMSSEGEILLEARWTQLTPNGSGGWLALTGDPLDEQADEVIQIDGTGTEKKTGVYCTGGLSRISDGRMPFMDPEGLYGALDASGAIAVSPVWQYMSAYSNGLAKVAGPEGMGLIDISGRTVIAPTLLWLERSPAMIAAWDGVNLDIYGPRGGQRRARLSGKIREIALAGDDLVVTYEGKTCLYDAYGRLLSQDNGSVCYTAGTRGQLIASNGQWGDKCQWLVNPDGSKASGLFQQLLPLCAERYAFLEMGGEAYESEALGRTQTAWNYGECRYGLMDGRGRILTSAKYRQIRALSGDRLLLIGDERVQIADQNGVVMKTWIIPEGAESSREAAE